jgi:hypothetical protein
MRGMSKEASHVATQLFDPGQLPAGIIRILLKCVRGTDNSNDRHTLRSEDPPSSKKGGPPPD